MSTSGGVRIFAFDIGVANMGMASIIMTNECETVIEKLDWRPLLTPAVGPAAAAAKKVNIGMIVQNTRAYVTEVMNGVNGPPDRVIVEQQFIAAGRGRQFGGGMEINIHALEIQTSLLTCFAERFPSATLHSVGAVARKGKVVRPKDRAFVIGKLFAASTSIEWSTYLSSLDDPQHTCDAITMILEHISYANLPWLAEQVRVYDRENAVTPKKKSHV